MKKKLIQYSYLLIILTAFACQSSDEGEEKSLASTHPKLEKQLERDSVRTPISSDERPDVYQRYRITMEKFETNKNYQVTEHFGGKLAPLDLNSHPEANTYKAALQKGMEQGINFADKYTVVTVGCGTACQYHFIIDRETGRITDKVQSSAGARYSENSRTFVVNPPDEGTHYEQCSYCTPEPYIIENGKLRKATADETE